jgi:hypothetical protein
MPPERSENPGSDSLEARLRRLPPPPIPSDLEARLLAAIPGRAPIRGWRWARWIGGVSALAAACLLIALVWPKRDERKPLTDLKGNRLATGVPNTSVSSQSPQGTSTPWSQVRGAPDDLKVGPFTWPIEEATPMTVASSIPSDLLD